MEQVESQNSNIFKKTYSNLFQTKHMHLPTAYWVDKTDLVIIISHDILVYY